MREVAETLGVSEPTVWRWVKIGELPSVKLGGRRLIPLKLLEEWLGSKTTLNTPDSSKESL